jgi:putative endonuclease
MSVGRTGEDIAASFLERRGAVVVDRYLRVGHDEIDLLVVLDGERVAVEVKTARTADAHPEDNFDDSKERRVRRAARNLSPPVWRIDLVTVVITEAGATVRWLAEV